MNSTLVKPTLAARRAALIAECARQRSDAGREISEFRASSLLGGGGIVQYLGSGGLKLPLTIAGVVLGMMVTKPSRAIPLLTTGLSLFKLVTSVLSALRKPAA
ncbi:MAG: hypothetical protein ACJ8GW_09770 [Massilia sp.]